LLIFGVERVVVAREGSGLWWQIDGSQNPENEQSCSFLGLGGYCTISFNLAGPVMCDRPAEILVSAFGRNHCDIVFFSAGHAIFFQILESLAGQILVQVVRFLVRTGRE